MTVLMLTGGMVIGSYASYLKNTAGATYALKFFFIMVLALSIFSVALSSITGRYFYLKKSGGRASYIELLKLIAFPVIVIGVSLTFYKVLAVADLFKPESGNRSLFPAFLIGSWFAASAIVTFVFRYPLAFLYRKESALLSALCLSPIIMHIKILDFSRGPLSLFWSWLDLTVLLSLFVFGTFQAHKNLTTRSRPTSQAAPEPRP
jgi:hypothetical protein